METQLVHANMQAIHNALRSLSAEEGEGLIEVIICYIQGARSFSFWLTSLVVNIVRHKDSLFSIKLDNCHFYY